MKTGWISEVKKFGTLKILLLLAAVAVLVMTSVPWSSKDESGQDLSQDEESLAGESDIFAYEKQLEERLESILGQIDGITSVDVMITLSATSEKVLEKSLSVEEEKNEEEKVSGDVTEKNSSSSISKKSEALLTDSNNKSEPYVLKELSPAVQGVLVTAQGDITKSKISEISEAVQALFDIEAHKVKVIEKKSQAEDAK